ncbi:MAG: hypothetical protein NTX72_04060 [Candidatus Uhrbacteria bacterium]|nr:hypothetical protein [Candidatus Uhrbacteria bacterium]
MNKNTIMERDLSTCEFVREQIKPPAKEGMDATKIRTYKMGECVVEFTLPADLVCDIMTVPGVGDILHAKVNGVDIHFHGGFQPTAGQLFTLSCETFVKTVERCKPDGSETNQGWRNYYYFLDLRPTMEDATKKLDIRDTASPNYNSEGRRFEDQIFDGHFCHVSGDKKRDTHIAFTSLKTGDTSMAQAFADRRPRRPVLASR